MGIQCKYVITPVNLFLISLKGIWLRTDKTSYLDIMEQNEADSSGSGGAEVVLPLSLFNINGSGCEVCTQSRAARKNGKYSWVLSLV